MKETIVVAEAEANLDKALTLLLLGSWDYNGNPIVNAKFPVVMENAFREHSESAIGFAINYIHRFESESAQRWALTNFLARCAKQLAGTNPPLANTAFTVADQHAPDNGILRGNVERVRPLLKIAAIA